MNKYRITYISYDGRKRQITANAIEECEDTTWFTIASDGNNPHYILNENIVNIKQL